MFYVAQTIDLLIRKALGNDKKSLMFFLLPLIIIPASIFGVGAFWFTFIFLAVYWSNICRSSGYGLSYHFPLVIMAGVIYGSLGGFIVGFLPFVIIPYLMPDKKVINAIVSSVLLGAIGFVSGFLSAGNPVLVQFAISALIIYNLIRAALLFGKIPIQKITLFIIVNIAINYFLIQTYLLNWISMIT